MLSLLLAAAVATASPPANALSEARHAIDAGRLDQARKMIANAIAGPRLARLVDRLIKREQGRFSRTAPRGGA